MALRALQKMMLKKNPKIRAFRREFSKNRKIAEKVAKNFKKSESKKCIPKKIMRRMNVFRSRDNAEKVKSANL
jgi:hypothetical protein